MRASESTVSIQPGTNWQGEEGDEGLKQSQEGSAIKLAQTGRSKDSRQSKDSCQSVVTAKVHCNKGRGKGSPHTPP